jgi:ureidoglycolate lyase
MNFFVVDRLGEGDNLVLHDLNSENITLEFKA